MAPDPHSSSKIPVSSSLLNPEHSSLPSNTRNALLSHLQDTAAISRLDSLLVDSLSRAGWTERVYGLALELLRSGDCTNLSEVLEQITQRACKGVGVTNGAVNEDIAGEYGRNTDVRIPKETVERSVKFLRDEIEGVIEVVHDEKNGGATTNGVNGHKGR